MSSFKTFLVPTVLSRKIPYLNYAKTDLPVELMDLIPYSCTPVNLFLVPHTSVILIVCKWRWWCGQFLVARISSRFWQVTSSVTRLMMKLAL